jgi:NTP pyrophosphatase (non-canonical NTP hydrolase)
MEQVMELLKAMQEKMDSDLREKKADLRTLIGCLASWMDSHHEELKALIHANL